MTPESLSQSRPDRMQHGGSFSTAMAVIGAAAFVLAIVSLRPLQFNVANYSVTRVDAPLSRSSAAFLACIVVTLITLCWNAARSAPGRSMYAAAVLLHPFLLCVPLAVFAFIRQPPPFAVTWLLILPFGLVALRAGARSALPSLAPSRGNSAAIAVVLVAIAVLTVVQVRIQVNFFEHFLLGHSDPPDGRVWQFLGLRSDGLPNARLGWHFNPLIFVLAPGYLLWPSPVYLMICGTVLLHLPAIPCFYLARRLSGSVMVGFLVACAWLLLPSCSRILYRNTYGFPWIIASMVLIAVMMNTALADRWGWSVVLMVLIWLCEETTTAVTFGWGIVLILFGRQKLLGALAAVGSVVYLLLCTQVFIPYFAASGQYERFSLFGELGDGVLDVVRSLFTQPRWASERLVRPQVWLFLVTLLTPMAFLPLVGWRLSLAAAPPLFLIALMQNAEWLSIKFWHQATVVPVLFVSGIAASLRGFSTPVQSSFAARLLFGQHPVSETGMKNGFACSLLACAALGHYLYGFSPLSKSFDLYARDPVLHAPDPRLALVEKLRSELPRDRSILATERLAAHFADYRRVHTGKPPQPADFVIVDRADSWDASGLPGRWMEFTQDPAYRLHGEFGSIIMFQRARDAPASDD